MPTRRSVHVVKALRSWIELAIAHPTTSADSADDVVVSVQVQRSGDILPFGVQALAAEDVLEWLQPSGRRPEGCCCSTELSGGRGRILGVAGYYTRPIMHAPHTLRLTLANVAERCHVSDVAQHWPQCTAVTRCSKSRAVATEKAATAPHRVRTAVLRQLSGHSRAMSAATIGQPRRPVACSGRAQRWGRGYGRLERYREAYKVPKHV